MSARSDRPIRGSVLRVSRQVRELSAQTQLYVEEVARRLGHHRTDVAAIGVLADARRDDQALGPGDLARTMHLSAAAVSALVDRLERGGHVRRHRHLTDRRKVCLDLTDEAATVSDTMFAPLSRDQQAALEGYSDAELDIAARVIVDLTEATRVSVRRELPADTADPDASAHD